MKSILFYMGLVLSTIGLACANDSTPQVTIGAITVVKDVPEQLVLKLEVDNQADGPAFVDCIDTYRGQSTGYWMVTRAFTQKGKHDYETSIGLNPQTAPERHVSDGILCQVHMDNVSTRVPLAQKHFSFNKSWVWTPPNKISEIRVVKEAGERIDLEVDYTYSGDHGDRDIYINCQAANDHGYAPLAMWPGAVTPGTHISRPAISSYVGEPPPSLVSTQIACKIGSRQGQDEFLSKRISFRKVWKPE